MNILRPQNIGEYLYKKDRKLLKRLFPKKTLKEIEKIIGGK